MNLRQPDFRTMPGWRTRWTLLAVVLLATLAVPDTGQAHPLGNFTINHYSRLEVSPERVQIFYILDMAEIAAFQAMQTLSDGDEPVSPAEGAAFAQAKMAELAGELRLTSQGAPIALTPRAPELSFPPGQGGLSLLRLSFWLDGSLPSEGGSGREVEYRDMNGPGRLGWREIVVRGMGGARISRSTVSERDVSDELRSYPIDMLSSPLNQTEARFSLIGGAPQQIVAATGSRTLGAAGNDGAFAALITLPNLDLRVVLLALLTALSLGALHALEPGHGKTAAAAYLVGARATPLHALVLGMTITAMHTSSVFVLGLITLFASRLIVPERLLPWLGLASGLIVIALGLQMFVSRLGQSRSATGASAQEHGHHAGYDHAHHAGHPHAHSHEHGHTHPLPGVLSGSRVSWRGVLAIGVSGGLLPCPAALIVLLSAIGLGRLGFGLLLIVAFSAGLALVLSGIGLAVLYGGRWLRRPGTRFVVASPAVMRLGHALPALSSLLVVGAGFLLLYHALPLLRIWQP